MPVIRGIKRWSMSRDKDFHRDYKISILVALDFLDDIYLGSSPQGPAIVSNTPGLPQVGDLWNFNDDVDIWAYCKADAQIEPYGPEVPNQYFLCTYRFSTKPDFRCNETTIEDPLLEPPKLSGSFTKYTLEATQDRFGNPINTSSFEQIRGPQNEWDANRQSVKIEMPVALLNLGVVASCMDTVNEFELWGNDPRTVKLSNASWEQVFFGECYVYYRWSFEFEINSDTWDRDLLDQGTKALHGENRAGMWVVTQLGTPLANPDPTNQNHFVQYKDPNGNPTTVILNGFGIPITQMGPQINPLTNTTVQQQVYPGTPFTFGPLHDVIGMPPASPANPGTITVQASPAPPSFDQDSTINITFNYTGISGNSLTGCTLTAGFTGATGYIIDASTQVYVSETTSPGYIHVEKYDESDFVTLLGIPSVLDPYSGL